MFHSVRKEKVIPYLLQVLHWFQKDRFSREKHTFLLNLYMDLEAFTGV